MKETDLYLSKIDNIHSNMTNYDIMFILFYINSLQKADHLILGFIPEDSFSRMGQI